MKDERKYQICDEFKGAEELGQAWRGLSATTLTSMNIRLVVSSIYVMIMGLLDTSRHIESKRSTIHDS